MMNEIKYALRSQRLVRVGILLPAAVIQAVLYFPFTWPYESLNYKIKNNVMLLFCLFTFAMLMICLTADLMAIDGACRIGSLEYMVPVAGWKRLLPRFGAAVLWDLICLSILVGEILAASLIPGEEGATINLPVVLPRLSGLLIEIAVFFLGYWMFVMLFFWGFTLSKTIFAAQGGGRFLSLGGVIVTVLIFNLSNGLFMLFPGALSRQFIIFPFFNIDFWQNLRTAFFPLTATFMLLTIVKIVILFLFGAYLWEKKADL